MSENMTANQKRHLKGSVYLLTMKVAICTRALNNYTHGLLDFPENHNVCKSELTVILSRLHINIEAFRDVLKTCIEYKLVDGSLLPSTERNIPNDSSWLNTL